MLFREDGELPPRAVLLRCSRQAGRASAPCCRRAPVPRARPCSCRPSAGPSRARHRRMAWLEDGDVPPGFCSTSVALPPPGAPGVPCKLGGFDCRPNHAPAWKPDPWRCEEEGSRLARIWRGGFLLPPPRAARSRAPTDPLLLLLFLLLRALPPCTPCTRSRTTQAPQRENSRWIESSQILHSACRSFNRARAPGLPAPGTTHVPCMFPGCSRAHAAPQREMLRSSPRLQNSPLHVVVVLPRSPSSSRFRTLPRNPAPHLLP